MGCITKHRIRRGTALVELAIVLPLLLVLIFGLVEYGWMFYKAQQINNATRHGARVGALIDSTSADAQAAVDVLMADAGITNYTVTLTPIDFGSLGTGDPLTVTVTAPYADLQLINFSLLPAPANLQASVSMAKEGF